MGSGLDFKKHGVQYSIIFLVIVIGIWYIYCYMNNKGKNGSESMSSNTTNSGVYKQSNSNTNSKNNKGSSSNTGVIPSEPLGQNEVFASVSGIGTPKQGMPSSCTKQNIQNPSELLPKDTNSQWAQLNPSGKGELANINLLKAGYHIGIDTIGQSLRNANLQIRSEPPNPQLYVGPWNASTITPDFLRPPLEIGSTTGKLI
jgi:hypothetical protein